MQSGRNNPSAQTASGKPIKFPDKGFSHCPIEVINKIQDFLFKLCGRVKTASSEAEWVSGETTTYLPKGITSYLEYAGSENDEPFLLDEFFKRVSVTAEIALSDADFLSGVVIEVLQRASNRSEDEYIHCELLQDYLTLFTKSNKKNRSRLLKSSAKMLFQLELLERMLQWEMRKALETFPYGI
ncbi:DUF2267 domain-containing protein [Myxosarcina sp. GI1]|uniref:DUF2267 domain-containing protein n=1 Tax=Myxosarcina sp. GI1 TaxID=1541065 RepID=UPI00056D2484|nr:DUF2267 domain-containing protein [Myxosarcina sp. GI1]